MNKIILAFAVIYIAISNVYIVIAQNDDTYDAKFKQMNESIEKSYYTNLSDITSFKIRLNNREFVPDPIGNCGVKIINNK